MKFTQPCFIRMNTPEIREGLEKLGYHICICANFDGAEWLDTLILNGTVHGIGYFDKEMFGSNWTKEKELNSHLSENKNSIDCKTNVELFLAIAALTDDTDENQYFVWDDIEDQGDRFKKYDDNPNWAWWIFECHKATVSELIEHFSK